MKTYIVTYLDSKYGDTVLEWIGEAEDEGDAMDKAMDEDYYFGQYLDCHEL